MQILAVSHYSPHETSNIAHDPQDHTRNIFLERYEYDAYGNAAMLDAQYAIRDTSLHDNPYSFQRKRLDLLDSGGLKLMSWPQRDYSTYLGRWLQAAYGSNHVAAHPARILKSV
jgi:hypothetical protein